MKRYIIYALSCALLGFSSCESFLDTPVPNIDQRTFFSSEKTAYSALVGIYDPAGWMGYIQYLDWAIGDVVSDDAVKGGGGDNDQPQIYDLEHFRATPELATLANAWSENYEGINRANCLIGGLKDNHVIKEEVRKRFVAEARFMRGYYYFCLMKVFGAVPIVDHVLAPSEYKGPRDTMERCWAFVEDDFKAAMEGLPHKKDMPASELGRATWGSAAAFRTKC